MSADIPAGDPRPITEARLLAMVNASGDSFWESDVQQREQAIRDDLTGVHNRRYFVAAAETELERARRHGSALALVMLDIDHFKQVNDQHGHAAGDEALKAVGGLLTSTTRVGDMACRLGGEEFAVLLPGMDAAAALQRAEHWRAALVALQVPGDGAGRGEMLRLSASFGVAHFPQEGDTLAALMKLADHRLYRAKALGRNRVVGPDEPA